MFFHMYGLFIGLAIVVGYTISEKLEPRVAKIAPWVIGLGLLGARIYHVIDLWEYYSQNLNQILAVWNGGLSIWGALVGGVIGSFIYHYTIKSLDHLESIFGAIVVALPLAQAIGRIGNGVNGEFTNLVGVLPWWSVEMILDLLLFGIMWGMHLRPARIATQGVAGGGFSPKVKVMTYLFGYGLIRYLLQPYR